MAGGNRHQRAVEKAARSRVERQVSDAVAGNLGNNVAPESNRQSSKPPWYERGLFWGCISLGTAIILTVIAAMEKDLRWLLIFFWPVTVIPLWIVCRELKLRLGRWSLFLLLSALTAFGLWRLDVSLKPKPDSLIAQSETVVIAGLDINPFRAGKIPVLDIHYRNAEKDILKLQACGLVFGVENMPRTAEDISSLEEEQWTAFHNKGCTEAPEIRVPNGIPVVMHIRGKEALTEKQFTMLKDREDAYYFMGMMIWKEQETYAEYDICLRATGDPPVSTLCQQHNGMPKNNAGAAADAFF